MENPVAQRRHYTDRADRAKAAVYISLFSAPVDPVNLMNLPLAALLALLLALAGCAAAPEKPTPPPAETPAISAEACDALARAEADVATARTLFALWTSARDALRAARDASLRGDSQAVIRHAIQASSQARLGIEQLDYPSTER